MGPVQLPPGIKLPETVPVPLPLLQAVKDPDGVPGGTATEKEEPGTVAVLPEMTTGTQTDCARAGLLDRHAKIANAAKRRPTADFLNTRNLHNSTNGIWNCPRPRRFADCRPDRHKPLLQQSHNQQ